MSNSTKFNLISFCTIAVSLQINVHLTLAIYISFFLFAFMLLNSYNGFGDDINLDEISSKIPTSMEEMNETIAHFFTNVTFFGLLIVIINKLFENAA